MLAEGGDGSFGGLVATENVCERCIRPGAALGPPGTSGAAGTGVGGG